MSHPRPVRSIVVGVVLVLAAAATIAAQGGNVPNPFREDANWAKVPAGAKWGGVISVDPASNGDMWVFHRSDPPILRFDPSGKIVKSFGQGQIVNAHGMTIDRDGNVWVTDAQIKDGKGNQVLKFNPDGKLLMAPAPTSSADRVTSPSRRTATSSWPTVTSRTFPSTAS